MGGGKGRGVRGEENGSFKAAMTLGYERLSMLQKHLKQAIGGRGKDFLFPKRICTLMTIVVLFVIACH